MSANGKNSEMPISWYTCNAPLPQVTSAGVLAMRSQMGGLKGQPTSQLASLPEHSVEMLKRTLAKILGEREVLLHSLCILLYGWLQGAM